MKVAVQLRIPVHMRPHDLNGDGEEDLLLLVSQGDERMVLLEKEAPDTLRIM